MNGGPDRRLRDDERELWTGITRSITPLRPQKEPQKEFKPESAAAVRAPRKAAAKARSVAVATLPVKPAVKPALPPALAPLSRRMKQRLARGTEKIAGRLDLHGRTQAQAHGALLGFLHAAQARGEKNVLVITGKGLRGGDGERGVLKRQVPLWLKLPEFRSLVVGFEDAHVGHGGEGALYVRLRKAK
jgi:DNA-nicking Smr family endonuclease